MIKIHCIKFSKDEQKRYFMKESLDQMFGQYALFYQTGKDIKSKHISRSDIMNRNQIN